MLNEKITSKEVRLIDDEGNNHGVISTAKALQMAQDKDLDLVVVSPNQEPPVAKILDYGNKVGTDALEIELLAVACGLIWHHHGVIER